MTNRKKLAINTKTSAPCPISRCLIINKIDSMIDVSPAGIEPALRA